MHLTHFIQIVEVPVTLMFPQNLLNLPTLEEDEDDISYN